MANFCGKRDIGGYDVNLMINQDVDFCFRMLLDHNIMGVDSPRALIRIHKGERVGHLRTEDKLIQVLHLRMQFIKTLEGLNKLKSEHQKALARYTFDLWKMYRHIYPQIAKDILNFSKKCDPHLRLRGTWPLRLLGFLVGAPKAIQIKYLINKIIQ